jgi:acyl-CoA synthetase (AMP-forming)/AMP-acid ligase II/acyl carrier protein
MDILTNKDIIIQMASGSSNVHIQEIIGALIVGSSVVMLHPQGNMDIKYVSKVLQEKQVSYMQSAPAYVSSMLEFLSKYNHPKFSTFRTLNIRSTMMFITDLKTYNMFFLDDVSTIQLVEKWHSRLVNNARTWNSYGSAETTIDCTYHLVDMNANHNILPIGHPLPNYKCIILDEFLQPVTIGQEGELFVAGVGLFAAYLGSDDLTSKVMIEINGVRYYRTGDLVRMDEKGLLYYIGRKDHQIKLHGRRIDLSEIERCLLGCTPVSACVVIKWNDNDQLIAYVQSSNVTDDQLHKYCRFHLPSHMIPSRFIILELLPLNENGTINRKLLPVSHCSSLTNANDINLTPLTPLEEKLQCIFSEVFDNESPNINMSFIQMGGKSLDAIRIRSLIRERIGIQIDASFIFTSSSIRQFARTIEALLLSDDKSSVKS